MYHVPCVQLTSTIMKLPDKKKLQALTRRPVERENDDSAKMAVMHPVQALGQYERSLGWNLDPPPLDS